MNLDIIGFELEEGIKILENEFKGFEFKTLETNSNRESIHRLSEKRIVRVRKIKDNTIEIIYCYF
ncbi:MAG: hypothetical protein Q4P31_05140 [Andreesenia angusta]|nr:hypothetical protein [Andreesenia angusta]